MLQPKVSLGAAAAQAMKADVSVKRVAAFAKRLLQIAAQAPAPFAAGTLFLLSEVLKARRQKCTAFKGRVPVFSNYGARPPHLFSVRQIGLGVPAIPQRTVESLTHIFAAMCSWWQ